MTAHEPNAPVILPTISEPITLPAALMSKIKVILPPGRIGETREGTSLLVAEYLLSQVMAGGKIPNRINTPNTPANSSALKKIPGNDNARISGGMSVRPYGSGALFVVGIWQQHLQIHHTQQ